MLSNAPVFATIPCVNMAGAREFYGQTLGLPEMQVFEEEGQMAAIMYGSGQETTLLVYARSTPAKVDNTAASWTVENIGAEVDHLIGSGVKFIVYEDMAGVEWDDRGVATMGDLKSAWFTDPEGNILSIVEMP
jgi:catechol 2,3-dioxygenase-like lactoylglutathione lyase family enzyme